MNPGFYEVPHFMNLAPSSFPYSYVAHKLYPGFNEHGFSKETGFCEPEFHDQSGFCELLRIQWYA